MAIAVIKTGGKQYKVKEGDIVIIEKIDGLKPDKRNIEFDDILSGKKVSASFLNEHKGPKVRIFKYKAKTRYRRVSGHRQKYIKIKIDKITSFEIFLWSKKSEHILEG